MGKLPHYFLYPKQGRKKLQQQQRKWKKFEFLVKKKYVAFKLCLHHWPHWQRRQSSINYFWLKCFSFYFAAKDVIKPSTCLFVNTKSRHFTGFESALLFVRTLLYSFFFYLERLYQLYDLRIQLCLLMNKKSF